MLLGAVSKMLIARRTLCALALACCALLSAPSPAAFVPQVELSDATLSPKAQAAVAIIRDDFSTPQQRADAARDLIGLSAEASVRDLLQQLINEPAGNATQAVIDGFAGLSEAHVRLFPMVTQRLAAAATPEEAARIIPALAPFRLRDTVRILSRYLTDDADDAAALAAMRCLVRVSGRDDIPLDRAAWRRFAEEVNELNDAQWRARLLSALSARERRLDEERRAAVAQLVDTLRRLHLATRPEERPAFLASLLLNETAEVRQLGFELVRRELSAAGQLDGPVGDAAIQLLSHPEASVRGDAAVLVRQLAPEGADEAVARALLTETNPVAAQNLLLAAARWPMPELSSAVIRWAEAATPARSAALEAAWWMHRAGQLAHGASARLLTVLRGLGNDELTPPGITLLASIGDDDDRSRIAPLLRSDDGAIRQAVGDALVWYSDFTREILDAAAYDPDLFVLAARAVLVHGPTEQAVRELLLLPLPTPEIAHRALLQTCNALPADELLSVAVDITDPSLRRGMLALLASPDRLMFEKADPAMLRAIAQGAIAMAELELDEGQPEAALAALNNAPSGDDLVDEEQLASLRCTVLLATGQVEVAEGLQAPAAAWLRGLELSKDAPHADRIVQVIDARFSSILTPEQRELVESVRKSLAAKDAVEKAAERPRPLPE